MKYFTLPVVQKKLIQLRNDLAILCTTCGREDNKKINPVPDVLIQTDDDGENWQIKEVRHSRYDKNNPHKSPCGAAEYLIGYVRINWECFLEELNK